MQEKKNKRLFISLVVLIFLTLAVFWKISGEHSLEIDNNIFRVEDFTEVDRITLTSPHHKIALHYNGAAWKVNQQHVADANMVKVLFATLKQAEPKRPVAASVNDSIASALEKQGCKASLFQRGTLVKEFYAGGNPTKTQAYFKLKDDAVVYLMTIPGYRVYVSGILELDESGWRDKYVFPFNWENFHSMHIEFPNNTKENFTAIATRDFFGIENMPQADTAKLASFLDQVSLLTVDRYESADRLRDSLAGVNPLMMITVTDVAKRNYVVELFKPVENQVPGIIQQKQGAFFDSRKIQPLLRPKSFFKK